MDKIDHTWKPLQKEYKLTKMLGQGSYGLVIKGKNRETLQEVAIKKIKCDFKNLKQIKYVMREITILRQLTKMDGCVFSPKLYDIIVPEKYLDRV